MKALPRAALLFVVISWFSMAAYGQGEKLTLTGEFIDADTVQIRVYHDNKMVAESQEVYSYAIELMEYKSYVIVFNDSKGREKRLWIPYTGDNLVEIAPPIDVEFNALGDLVIVKENARKKGFDLYDVGLFRKKKK